MAADLDLEDARVEFIAGYVLRSLKIRGDKFTKMYSVEENKLVIMDFFEKADNMVMILQVGAGALAVSYGWPESLKSKACYFRRKGKDLIGKEADMKEVLYYGDLSPSPLDQLSSFVEGVSFSRGYYNNKLLLYYIIQLCYHLIIPYHSVIISFYIFIFFRYHITIL